MTTVRAKLGHSRSNPSARRSPVVAWATIGAATCMLMVYVLVRWVTHGVETLDPGRDDFSGFSLALVRLLEWSQFVVLLVLLGAYVVRPLIRRIGLGFDGLFILAALALNFWDPLDNYLRIHSRLGLRAGRVGGARVLCFRRVHLGVLFCGTVG